MANHIIDDLPIIDVPPMPDRDIHYTIDVSEYDQDIQNIILKTWQYRENQIKTLAGDIAEHKAVEPEIAENSVKARLFELSRSIED